MTVKDTDMGLDALIRQAGSADDVTVDVGIFDGENATKGAYNEFGTSTIPARPFLRSSFDDHQGEYEAALRKDGERILAGQTTAKASLNKLGIKAVGHVKRRITSLKTPPNAPSTIAAKGSSNPLIDTGGLRNAVTYQLTDGGGGDS